MSYREQYTPGPASGAQIQKDGEKWTLILVRELRHSPEKVWEAFNRSGASTRVGSIRRRWKLGHGRKHGEAHDSGERPRCA